MTTNLLTQYNYNKGKVILAIPECYSAFKTNIESAINSKQDLDLDTMSDNGMDNTPYVNINGIAILDFQGFTVSSCSPLEAAFFGLVSLQDFCEDLTEAIEDESVTTVIINFDSGGCYTSYGEETCELLQTLKEVKPIYAYTSGLMCSMAYKIACNCNNIIASPSAIVGSIGTYCEYVTYNGASELSDTGVTVSNLADLGITVTTFQGGPLKTGLLNLNLNQFHIKESSAYFTGG